MSLTMERSEAEKKPMFDRVKSAVFGNAPTATHRAVIAETPHQKVFRLIGERQIEEGARIAARLINSGEADGFFIYGETAQYRRAEAWFAERVQAGKRGQSSAVETITPEVAQILLKSNDGNRRVNAGALANIIRDILSGGWELNGETFKVSRDGFLNDSQHRNFGVLISGHPIKSYVVFGVQRETMRTVDVGRKRTSADRLALKGESEYVACSAISGLAFEVYNGRSGSARELGEYFEENAEEIRLSNKLVGANIRGLGPSIAGVAALHLLRLGASQRDIQNFFKIVRTGDALRKDAARTVYDALNPKQGSSALKQKRAEWVNTLVHHFISWRDGVPRRAPIVGETLPESM